MAPEERNYRLTIGISAFDLKRLKAWAKAHGKTASTYAAQIVAARIESNLALIDELAARQAADSGISIDEFWDSLESQSDDD